MPVTLNPTYKPPVFLRGRHIQTIFPALFRKVKDLPNFDRKKLILSDGDFIEYDHYEHGNRKVVIISHGLEGNSQRPYILGLAKICVAHGFDVLAWNFRSCGEKMNNKTIFYHSGATYDLNEVVKKADEQYDQICLCGFSLGANLTLKFAGEPFAKMYSSLYKIVAICAPLDLKKGSLNINKPSNWLYATRFLRKLRTKIKEKDRQMPGNLDTSHLAHIKTLYDFDEHYTSKLHGFENADDYYEQCSAIHYIQKIAQETLVLNAINDPLLPRETLHEEQFISLENVILELTEQGGHCGYPLLTNDGYYWSEKRVIAFLND